MSEPACSSCGRPAPADDDEALARWAPVNDAQEIYCPDCLTPREADCLSAVAVQAVEDQMMLDRLPDAGESVLLPQQGPGEPMPADIDPAANNS